MSEGETQDRIKYLEEMQEEILRRLKIDHVGWLQEKAFQRAIREILLELIEQVDPSAVERFPDVLQGKTDFHYQRLLLEMDDDLAVGLDEILPANAVIEENPKLFDQ